MKKYFDICHLLVLVTNSSKCGLKLALIDYGTVIQVNMLRITTIYTQLQFNNFLTLCPTIARISYFLTFHQKRASEEAFLGFQFKCCHLLLFHNWIGIKINMLHKASSQDDLWLNFVIWRITSKKIIHSQSIVLILSCLPLICLRWW